MVSDYECNQCKLEFSVGAYHYHDFSNGYGGRRLLVCKNCGGQHALEIALPSSEIEFNEVFEVVVNNFNKEGKKYLLLEVRKNNNISIKESLNLVNEPPFVFLNEVTEKGAEKCINRLHNRGVQAESRVYDRRKNPMYGLNKKDKFLYKLATPNAEWHEEEITPEIFESEQRVCESLLQCHFCKGPKVLASVWEAKNDTCPACKNKTIKLRGNWLT